METLTWRHVAETARLGRHWFDGVAYLYLEWAVLVLGSVFDLDAVLWAAERLLLRLTKAGL